MLSQYAAIVATALLLCVIFFQLLLAAGVPWGHAAWGGQHRVLPGRLRLGSLVAAAMLALAAWVVLTRAGLLGTESVSTMVGIATWVFAGFFALNTLGNFVSKSPVERKVMTPVTLILVVCFVLVALN